MSSALVSLVTPVFNGLPYVEACLDNILTQTYERIEHVFVDGCSTDGTVEMLARYTERHPERIKFTSAPDNGPGDAWNKGLKMASGDIFGCIGADDLFERDAVEGVVDFFATHSDACFVHGHCDRINESGDVIARQRAEPFELQDFVNTALNICTPSAFYRRCVMETIGWLDASGDDFEVMIKIMQHFEIHRIDRVLSKVRVRAGSLYNPGDFSSVEALHRKTYLVSRRYGGDLWSPISLKYHLVSLVSILGLGSYWPLAVNAVRESRRILGLRRIAF